MNLNSEIEKALGSPVRALRELGGGCVGEVHAATLANDERVVVKVDRRSAPSLDTEGFMLSYLAEHSRLPVPAVHFCSPQLLIMDFVAGTSAFTAQAERHAAELLAALHAIEGQAFGLEQDTLIGGLHQPNPLSSSWVNFFRESRLLHMAHKAVEEGRIDRGLERRIEAFCNDLEQYLDEPEYPSLLHGDVWTTNVLAQRGRITAFIDPAVYYGHPEVELAFITLFSTFGHSFFAHYRTLRALREGFFEQRRDIYNLYPLLVHVRLFGGGYVHSVERILSQLGY